MTQGGGIFTRGWHLHAGVGMSKVLVEDGQGSVVVPVNGAPSTAANDDGGMIGLIDLGWSRHSHDWPAFARFCRVQHALHRPRAAWARVHPSTVQGLVYAGVDGWTLSSSPDLRAWS